LVAGAIAGVIGGSITFPLDTIKTRLQNNAKGEYQGIVDVIRKTYAREGVRGFYKGLPAVMVGITPEKAIKLGGTCQSYKSSFLALESARGQSVVRRETGGEWTRTITLLQRSISDH